MSSARRSATRIPTWAVVTLIVAGGVAVALLLGLNSDQHSRTDTDGSDSVAAALARLPPVFPTATPAPYPVRDAPSASAPDDVRTEAVDEELRAALNVEQYADIRSEAPNSWVASMRSLEVQGNIILVTLDLGPEDVDADATAEDAALGISVILPANFVTEIDWIVTQDIDGNELARAEPIPPNVEAPPALGFLG